MLGLATTVVNTDTRVSNVWLKGLNRPAARNAKNMVSWDMLLKIACKTPRTRERGAILEYPGRKERPGRQVDSMWKSFYKSRMKIFGATVSIVGSP